MPVKRSTYYYRRQGLKPVTAFLSPKNLISLKRLAREADKTLTRYVTRLLERHIAEKASNP